MQNLRLFSDVARLHSFSQAAALHGITQSAASQRVSALEKRLGATLIDRSVRPLGLTLAGKVFLAGCEDLLDRYDRLEAKVAALGAEANGSTKNADALEGLVRVAAIYSAGIDLLSDVRERFEAAHPKVEVEIHYDQPDQVHRAVLEGGADLGIVSYPQGWKKVGIIPLRDETMAVVCRPDHELAQRVIRGDSGGGGGRGARKAVRASDLVGLEMATFDADLPVGRRLREYLRDNGALNGAAGSGGVRITSVFDNIDTIKTAVAVTDEFSILPKRTVVREAAAGTLAVIPLEPRLVRPIGVIFKKRGRGGSSGAGTGGSPFAPATQAFVDVLLEQAGPKADEATEQAVGSELAGATR